MGFLRKGSGYGIRQVFDPVERMWTFNTPEPLTKDMESAVIDFVRHVLRHDLISRGIRAYFGKRYRVRRFHFVHDRDTLNPAMPPTHGIHGEIPFQPDQDRRSSVHDHRMCRRMQPGNLLEDRVLRIHVRQ